MTKHFCKRGLRIGREIVSLVIKGLELMSRDGCAIAIFPFCLFGGQGSLIHGHLDGHSHIKVMYLRNGIKCAF